MCFPLRALGNGNFLKLHSLMKYMSSYVRSREGSGLALVNERVSHTSLSLMDLGGNVEPSFACSRTEEGGF